MATERWVEISAKYCHMIQQNVTLRARRVYPVDFLPDMEPHRTLACACSAALDCNLADIPCKWAFTNPDSDQFVLS